MMWSKGIDYPEWMDEASLSTLRKGYLLGDETPKEAMWEIACKVEEYLPGVCREGEISEKLFNYLWKGWICPSTPMWSNFRHKRGASISCFSSLVTDSIPSIGFTLSEVMRMTQLGGGTSVYWGDVRPRGSAISSGGKTNGTLSFIEIFDTMINKVSQGSARRGACAVYLPIDHGDIEEFLSIKDNDSPIKSLFTGVCIPDSFITKLYDGDSYSLGIWARLLKSRSEKGLPYLFFTDNANNHYSTPEWYGHKQTNPDYFIKCSNLCSEVFLPINEEESFVCCVLSLNVAKYDEWRDTDAAQFAVYLADAVMSDFIYKTKGDKLMKRAHKFAKDHRPLGVGVLGWHTYLQSKSLPFASVSSKSLNNAVFKHIRAEAETATKHLGEILGPCKIGDGKRRNSTLLAVAPTTSNATIQEGVSPGIEPLASNFFIQKSAKGDFVRKNKYLEQLLISVGMNTDEVWESIKKEDGSVHHLHFLTQDQKDVFKTFKEINQYAIIDQAADRQMFIDQGQSLNIFIPLDAEPKDVSKIHLYAHKRGLKGLYYQRGETIMNTSTASSNTLDDSCLFCQG